MRKTFLIVAAATLLGTPAFAADHGHAYGHDPKVCLLTFTSADQRGADAAVVKAQYLPLSIAAKLRKDTTTQGVAYYGFGDLTTEQRALVDFYYPTGSFSDVIGVPNNADTKTLCQAFMTYAENHDSD